MPTRRVTHLSLALFLSCSGPLLGGCESSVEDGEGGGDAASSSSVSSTTTGTSVGGGGQGGGAGQGGGGGTGPCGELGLPCCDGACTGDGVVCDAGTCTGCVERAVGSARAGGGCVVNKAGTQLCWGDNNDEQLVCGGVGAYLPREIDHVGDGRVDALGAHVCAITADADAHCWGYNGSGEAGLDPGVVGNGVCPGTAVSLPGDVASLAVGDGFTLAVQTDGTVYGWGANDYGQLFINSDDDALDHFVPVEMTWAPPSSAALALWISSCVLTLDKTVVCVGSNQTYRLGTTASVGFPARVEVDLEGVEQLVGASDTVCTRNDLGEVWCWGANGNDQIDPQLGTPLGPTRVTLPSAAQHIASGTGFTCAILEDDEVYCWGSNVEKELGACDLGQYPGPQYVHLDLEKTQRLRAKSLAPGYGHMCAVDLDDHLWCWGKNTFFNTGTTMDLEPVCPPRRVDLSCD